MANTSRGIIDLDAGGKVWRLQFTVNAFCALEAATGRNSGDVLTEFAQGVLSQNVSVLDARQLMRAALMEHHPDVTVTEAGRIMQDAGGLPAAVAVLNEALIAAAAPRDASDPPGKPETAAA